VAVDVDVVAIFDVVEIAPVVAKVPAVLFKVYVVAPPDFPIIVPELISV
jgi:hypothetical protein